MLTLTFSYCFLEHSYTALEKLGNFARINLSSDGRFLASGGESPDVVLWDTLDKKENPDPFTILKDSRSEAFTEAVCFNQHDNLEVIFTLQFSPDLMSCFIHFMESFYLIHFYLCF